MNCQQSSFLVPDSNISHEPGSVVQDYEVTSTDVLSKRGKGVATRDGNMFYSRLIHAYKDEYRNQKVTKLKKNVAQKVLDIIKMQEPPGRFMKSGIGNNSYEEVWIVKDDKFAMKKVTQALREKPRSKKSKHEEEPVIRNCEHEEENSSGTNEKKKRSILSRILKRGSTLPTDNAGSDSDDLSSNVNVIIDVDDFDGINERPTKRCMIDKNSKRRLFTWMKSLSKQEETLLNSSLISFDADSEKLINSLEQNDVKGGMEKLLSERVMIISMKSMSTTASNDPNNKTSHDAENCCTSVRFLSPTESEGYLKSMNSSSTLELLNSSLKSFDLVSERLLESLEQDEDTKCTMGMKRLSLNDHVHLMNISIKSLFTTDSNNQDKTSSDLESYDEYNDDDFKDLSSDEECDMSMSSNNTDFFNKWSINIDAPRLSIVNESLIPEGMRSGHVDFFDKWSNNLDESRLSLVNETSEGLSSSEMALNEVDDENDDVITKVVSNINGP